MPALVDDIMHRLRHSLWHLQKTAVHDILHHLCVGAIRVGVLPKGENLPEQNSKRPDVRVHGELAVLEALWSQPAKGHWSGLVAAADNAVVLCMGEVAQTKVGYFHSQVLANLVTWKGLMT